MNERDKRRPGKFTAVEAPTQEGFPLPETVILNEILRILDLESLCTLACVCRALRSVAYQAIGALSSIDLSGFSVREELLDHIIPRLKAVKSVTVDCLRLDDFYILRILGPCIQELNLLKCVSLSYNVLPLIGVKCPNLRILVLEVAGQSSPASFRINLREMLKSLSYLEDLSIKIRGTETDACYLTEINLFLPRIVKFLKLQSVTDEDAIQFIEKLRCDREIPRTSLNNISSNLGFIGDKLLRLSLVLNVISDRLMFSISGSLPLLVELHLEDRPCEEPKLPHDLTDSGLQFLSSCHHLKHLSIVRSRQNCPSSFKRVNDIGLLLFSESCACGGLESVKLGGFSKVTDAGFSSLLRVCRNLKKFDVRNAPLLSDLAFHDVSACPLVELKIQSCNLITSEAIAELTSSSSLQVLDTYGCRSVADPCLEYTSPLSKLTSLNLGGSDVTDHGLLVLSKANLPITNLCLRGCVRITDRGISSLFSSQKRIKKTLSSLDIGHMPGISDRAIQSVVSNAEAISELSIRHCYHVTDISFVTLASGRGDKSCQIQKLDAACCMRFSEAMVDLLRTPLSRSFRGLRWLGIGGTSLAKSVDFASISLARPWLTMCVGGCEVGCHDGWHFHNNIDE